MPSVSHKHRPSAHVESPSGLPGGAHDPDGRTRLGRLQLRGLSVRLKEFHLSDIRLDVEPGEYFVVLGPTGAGKTVLLETIAGLFEPRDGRVLMDGRDITQVPPERRGIGFVYQDYVLFPHLKAGENIGFGLRLNHPSWPRSLVRAFGRLLDQTTHPHRLRSESARHHDVQRRVDEVSRLLSIDHLLHRRPDTLSGGEQQRVALARALVVEPLLLLLDEPLSALDPETRQSLQRELARVHRELGTTTLHVTHDFEEAVALGDRIAVVYEGEIVQVGTPEDIFRRPANEFVARFVGVRNVFAGHLQPGQPRPAQPGATVAPAGQAVTHKTFVSGELELEVDTDLTGPAHASIRPEDIIISTEAIRSSARNHFEGPIVEIADRGTLIYITVEAPHDITCIITRRSMEEMALQEGKEVHIAFKASAVHVF